MQVRAMFVPKDRCNIKQIGLEYSVNKKSDYGQDLGDLFRSRIMGFALDSDAFVILGGRNSIRTALSLGQNKDFVAAPNERLYLDFTHIESQKGNAAYGATMMTAQMVTGPGMLAGTAAAMAVAKKGSFSDNYASMMDRLYSPRGIAKTTTALSGLTKKFTVVSLMSAPAVPTAICLGTRASAARIAIELASKWGI